MFISVSVLLWIWKISSTLDTPTGLINSTRSLLTPNTMCSCRLRRKFPVYLQPNLESESPFCHQTQLESPEYLSTGNTAASTKLLDVTVPLEPTMVILSWHPAFDRASTWLTIKEFEKLITFCKRLW